MITFLFRVVKTWESAVKGLCTPEMHYTRQVMLKFWITRMEEK